MTRIALGTVQFGLKYGIANTAGQVPLPIIESMLNLAAAKGIDTLDTAISYGESESCLGKVGVDRFKVVTKLPAIPVECQNIADWINTQVLESLARLGVKKIYGILLHQSGDILRSDGEAIYQALQILKSNGLVDKIGVSIYSPDDLEVIISRFNIELVQAPLNLLDQRIATNGWLQRLKEKDIEIHTRSAFLQGLLLMPRSNISSKFMRWEKLWDQWHNWLIENSVTALQACLSFPLSFPEVDRVVIGVDSKDQLEQIIAAESIRMDYGFPEISCADVHLIHPSKWIAL